MKNLFIVENDGTIAMNIHKIIEEKFGALFTIFHFANAAEAIGKINENTKLILLDSDYLGGRGNKIINFVKNINSNTKIIILSQNIDLINAVETFIIDEKNISKKNLLNPKLSRIVHYPAYHFHEKYGVTPIVFYAILIILILLILAYFGNGKIY